MAENLVVTLPEPKAKPRTWNAGASLYRVVWRWHFYAGVLIAPVLVVVAVTGGLYVFKSELERWIYPGVMFVAPGGSTVPYDAQVAAATGIMPKGTSADRLTVPADPTRATVVSFTGKRKRLQDVFVSPRTGAVQGSVEDGGFFGLVLDIHRELFAGSKGRALVELTTCWTIVLLVTGTYLWWPRGRKKVDGVFVPRLRAKPYVILRDLHAVGGFYLLPVAVTIACTGLIYTLLWGTGYRYVAVKSGATAFFANPPKSTSPASAPTLPLDEVVAIGRRHFPGRTLMVTLPKKPDRGFMITARSDQGRPIRGALVLERATGAVQAQLDPDRLPALGWWAGWNYTLHIGTLFGTVTKVIWLATCLVLVMLPVTGLWMWWERRPRGRTGFPRRPEMRIPGWLAVVITGLSVVLPTVGLSVVVLIAGEWLLTRLWRPWRPAAAPAS